MSQPYLFYSDRCPNSNQVIETLKALNKAGLYKFVKVETIPRDKIPAFLKKVPTLFVPDTQEAIVGKDIYGFIAKPTNARNEKPVSRDANSAGAQTAGSSAQVPGEYTPWGFDGNSALGEPYSLWDAPNRFTSQDTGGGSMYTFLDAGAPGPAGPQGPTTQNTISNEKAQTNSDVGDRMKAMEAQREKEFGGIARK